jgi:alpha-glucosidase
MRPCALHSPDDPATHSLHTQFMLGPDLLVAPVTAAGVHRWQAWLPAGADWRHLWTGLRHAGGRRVEVAAPLGRPPVFVRDPALHAPLLPGPDAP